MSRAAILIGVNNTGGLPVLSAATDGAKRMAEWAARQEMCRVTLLTDDDGPVTAADVKRAVEEVVELGGIEKLVIYFAGHGVNIGYGERWLLSKAPKDPQEAVNVPGSAQLARWGRIPYVVFVSDACRTAASGVPAQAVEGSVIFPNEDLADGELSIDLFYACRVGAGAHEATDPGASSKAYRAVYTDALVEALEGGEETVVDGDGFVRPWPLKRHLRSAVTHRLAELGLHLTVVQVPDAQITSDETAWISKVGREGTAGPSSPDFDPAPRSTELRHMDVAVPDPGADAGVIANLRMVRRLRLLEEPFEFGPIPTRSGFAVRGATLLDVHAPSSAVLQVTGSLAALEARNGSALLVLEDGQGVALPVVPHRIGLITVHEGEVADVEYVATGTVSWHVERRLRALVAAAAGEGLGASLVEMAVNLEERESRHRRVVRDPALLLYAAYAAVGTRWRSRVDQWHGQVADDLDAPIFDLAVLNRDRDVRARSLRGFAPMLTEGWALLPGARFVVPDWVRELQGHVLPNSLWTLYDPVGVELIRTAMEERRTP